jgi:hypothetical protein
MYIPKEIKVRIQFNSTRWNQATGKHEAVNENEKGPHLGYATYLDEKGKLRKETSWKGWGHKHIGDFKNIPKRGFKLEKTVSRSRDWFGSGKTMFRIVHPDNFIFEISSDNFSEICQSCDLRKGLIEDDCVLAWDGTNLALIPCSTEDFIEHSKETAGIEAGPVKNSELIIGDNYKERNGNDLGHYAGKFYVLETVVTEYNKDGKSHEEYTKDCYRRDFQAVRADVTYIIKQRHFFRRGRDYFNSLASPKAYVSDAQKYVFVPGSIPKTSSYESPIIPDELAKSKDKNAIIEWAHTNSASMRNILGVECVMKFDVKF